MNEGLANNLEGTREYKSVFVERREPLGRRDDLDSLGLVFLRYEHQQNHGLLAVPKLRHCAACAASQRIANIDC